MNKWFVRLVVVGLVSLFAHQVCLAGDLDVGVMWIGKSDMPKAIMKGMTTVLKEKAPDINMEFKIELANDAAAAPVYNDWQTQKKAIVFLRSNGADYVKKNPSKIPVLIGGCNHPTQLGLIKNLDAPEGNITGTTYYVSGEKKVAAFKKAYPKLKKLGLLAEKGFPATTVDVAETKAACEKLGLEYSETLCADATELLKAAKEMSTKVDMIVLGTSAMAADNAFKLSSLVGNIPMASYNPSAIKGTGAVFGLVADDEKLGRLLGESVIALVKNGKKISEIPVKMDNQPQFLINETMAKKLGLEIPEEVSKQAKMVK